MMPLSDFMTCNIGGAAFQLLSYGLKEEPVVDATKGRTGTKITLTGEGEITGTTQAELNANLSAAFASFGRSGQNLFITGLGGATEIALPAAACLNGGPHLTWQVEPQSDRPMQRNVQFVAAAEVGYGKDPTGNTPQNHYTQTIETRPDFLKTVTREGEVGGSGAMQFFLLTALPEFQAIYKWPYWVVSHRVAQSDDATSTKVTYTIKAVELIGPLPTDGGFDQAVEGSAQTRVDRDEKFRKTTEWTFDLLVDGDPVSLLQTLRPDGTILAESYDLEFIKENRLRASFTKLESADNNGLLDWNVEMKVQDETVPHEGIEYPFGNPVVLVGQAPLYRITLSGTAIGQGKWVKPPVKPYGQGGKTGESEKLGEISFKSLNEVEKQTSWTFTFVFAEHPVLNAAALAVLNRPSKPEFY
jgi:hypothetical protein